MDHMVFYHSRPKAGVKGVLGRVQAPRAGSSRSWRSSAGRRRCISGLRGPFPRPNSGVRAGILTPRGASIGDRRPNGIRRAHEEEGLATERHQAGGEDHGHHSYNTIEHIMI